MGARDKGWGEWGGGGLSRKRSNDYHARNKYLMTELGMLQINRHEVESNADLSTFIITV